MNAHTPTLELRMAERGKTEILNWWESMPKEVQANNAEYIADLTRKVRQLRVYLDHRKDAGL